METKFYTEMLKEQKKLRSRLARKSHEKREVEKDLEQLLTNHMAILKKYRIEKRRADEALAMVKKLDDSNREFAKQVLDTGKAYDDLYIKYKRLFWMYICLGIMCLGAMAIIYYLLNQ